LWTVDFGQQNDFQAASPRVEYVPALNGPPKLGAIGPVAQANAAGRNALLFYGSLLGPKDFPSESNRLEAPGLDGTQPQVTGGRRSIETRVPPTPPPGGPREPDHPPPFGGIRPRITCSAVFLPYGRVGNAPG
jgi:hypothetical protein